MRHIDQIKDVMDSIMGDTDILMKQVTDMQY